MKATIATLPGDGVGPEVVQAAVQLLETVGQLFDHQFSCPVYPVGGASIDRFGKPLVPAVHRACLDADAVLFGAVGGAQWDGEKRENRPEMALKALRQSLGLFANLRPIRPLPALSGCSPLKATYLEGVDFVIVRELSSGIYYGQPSQEQHRDDGAVWAVDSTIYRDFEVTRVVDVALRLAKHRRQTLTSVDKANALATSRLWRRIVDAQAQQAEIPVNHLFVDNAAFQLIKNPQQFDVIITSNMFGDILSDESAVLVGSLGMLPSASLSETGPCLYEPVHGSAPDIAGQNQANPLATILSVALLLRFSLNLNEEADLIEQAVAAAVAHGARTVDIAGSHAAISTAEMGAEVITQLRTIAKTNHL